MRTLAANYASHSQCDGVDVLAACCHVLAILIDFDTVQRCEYFCESMCIHIPARAKPSFTVSQHAAAALLGCACEVTHLMTLARWCLDLTTKTPAVVFKLQNLLKDRALLCRIRIWFCPYSRYGNRGRAVCWIALQVYISIRCSTVLCVSWHFGCCAKRPASVHN